MGGDPSRRYVLLTPCEIARFADDRQEDDDDEDPPEEPALPLAGFVARLGQYLDRLPQSEREVITLCLLQGRTQRAAAEILNVTQQSVHKRQQRALERLRFWVALPTWTADDVHQACQRSGVLTNVQLCVVVSFWRTTCCAQTSRDLGISEFWVRTQLDRALGLLAARPELVPYAEALRLIRDSGLMGHQRSKGSE